MLSVFSWMFLELIKCFSTVELHSSDKKPVETRLKAGMQPESLSEEVGLAIHFNWKSSILDELALSRSSLKSEIRVDYGNMLNNTAANTSLTACGVAFFRSDQCWLPTDVRILLKTAFKIAWSARTRTREIWLFLLASLLFGFQKHWARSGVGVLLSWCPGCWLRSWLMRCWRGEYDGTSQVGLWFWPLSSKIHRLPSPAVSVAASLRNHLLTDFKPWLPRSQSCFGCSWN